MMDMSLGSRAIKRIATVSLLLTLITLSFATLATIPMAQLSTEQRRQTEAMLTQHLKRFISRQKHIEGIGIFVKVHVRLDQIEGRVIIDLSQNYLSGTDEIPIDLLTQELMNEVIFLLNDSIDLHGVIFTIDGKDLGEILYPEALQSPRTDASASALDGRDDLVAVSAGHGKYLHFGRLGNNPTWKWQRPTESNGIIEDINNPHFANELSHWFYWRSYDDVITSLPRSTSTATHAPSGEEWWKVAGKYHLESVYPDNPEIWNFKAYGNLPTADYNNDINSRPQYANHINATAIIHLHSNASPNTEARGTDVLYHAGREQDRLLASSILCSMKEIIQSQEAYNAFPVRAIPVDASNKGENSLALMPSVIIEVGFHTNPTDAAALLDPVFRTASMKGVEKGYRLYRNGLPCELFEITNIPHVTVRDNGAIVELETYYSGNPQYPLTSVHEVVSCPSGAICHETSLRIDHGSSPLRSRIYCSGSPGTVQMRKTLIDIDGVRTEPFDYNYTCASASGSSEHRPAE